MKLTRSLFSKRYLDKDLYLWDTVPPTARSTSRTGWRAKESLYNLTGIETFFRRVNQLFYTSPNLTNPNMLIETSVAPAATEGMTGSDRRRYKHVKP